MKRLFRSLIDLHLDHVGAFSGLHYPVHLSGSSRPVVIESCNYYPQKLYGCCDRCCLPVALILRILPSSKNLSCVSNLARFCTPNSLLDSSPNASTRIAKAALAANIRDILPFNLLLAWVIS
ncbi:hypothetical protein DERF_006881 [Dermatophagoides farinae]|uniref:Uncharacterized protein n=1 Tax=Dermatophagoides farinae TaxID=6954 RepID=A0A922L5G4_DERFA|nr:hypothetical protein DERF_006881 [Dermatophagoides farinae]